MSYNHGNRWLVFSMLTCMLWRIRILMLGCQRLKNDDCDRCTDDFSHFLGLKYYQ